MFISLKLKRFILPVMSVGSQNGSSVTSVGQALDPDALPRIVDYTLGVALVEISPISAHSNFLTIGRPGNCSQRIFSGVRNFAFNFSLLYIPKDDLKIGNAKILRYTFGNKQLTSSLSSGPQTASLVPSGLQAKYETPWLCRSRVLKCFS